MKIKHNIIKIFAVDFDGTLCKDNYPNIGKPNKKIIKFVKRIIKSNQIVILWTCRQDTLLDSAVEWCRTQGIEFTYINKNAKSNIEKYNNDSRKIFADYYIDDKAIRIKHPTLR